MVFARTKLTIADDLLRPRNKMEMSFSNIKSERFYQEIPKLLMQIFRVDERHVQEKKFSWTHGEPQNFKVSWEAHKELDAFSTVVVMIDIDGASSKGVGSASVILEAYLKTEYPQDTFWERSIFYEMMRMLWHKAFYIKKRAEYIAEGRRQMGILIDSLKKLK